MKEIDKTIEKKIKELINQNKIIEAVTIVQKELQLGLKKSKEIVDTYRK